MVTIGATAGKAYVVGPTAGKIADDPADDLVSTNKATFVGIGTGSNHLLFDPVYDAGSVVP